MRLASSLLPIGPTVITPRPSLAGAHRNPPPPRVARRSGFHRTRRERGTPRAISLARTQRQLGDEPSIVHLALSSYIEVGILTSVPYNRTDLHFPRSKCKRCMITRRRKGEETRGVQNVQRTDVPLDAMYVPSRIDSRKSGDLDISFVAFQHFRLAVTT